MFSSLIRTFVESGAHRERRAVGGRRVEHFVVAKSSVDPARRIERILLSHALLVTHGGKGKNETENGHESDAETTAVQIEAVDRIPSHPCTIRVEIKIMLLSSQKLQIVLYCISYNTQPVFSFVV